MSRNWTERHIRDLVREYAGTGQGNLAAVINQLTSGPSGYWNNLYLELPIADNAGHTGVISVSNPRYDEGVAGSITHFTITIDGNLNWSSQLLIPIGVVSDTVSIRAGDLSAFDPIDAALITSTISLGTAITVNKQDNIDTLVLAQDTGTSFAANGVVTSGIRMTTQSSTSINQCRGLRFTGVPSGTTKLQWTASI